MSVARHLDDYASALGYGRMQTQRERDGNLAAWGCLLTFTLWPVSLAFRGYVLQQLWAWFLVPLGVVAISLPHALGISGLIWFFVMHTPSVTKDDDDAGTKIVKALLWQFGTPVMALASGWLWHWWM